MIPTSVLILAIALISENYGLGILPHKPSAIRESISLDGIWNFALLHNSTVAQNRKVQINYP